MQRIVSVTSSRADVGILTPVWNAIAAHGNCDLHLFATGMHVADDAPPIDSAPGAATVHQGGADLGGAGAGDAARAMAAIGQAAGLLYTKIEPDVLLVIGDRLDMIPAALAALPFNSPVVHLHGGELTQGAIDDRARYAISSLAHVHCVSTPDARERLIRCGEEPWRIHLTGAPGLDTLKNAELMTAEDFAAEVGLGDVKGLRIVTVHAETNSEQPEAPLDAVLSALENDPMPTLFTAPNSDPGGADMKHRIIAFVAAHKWAVFVDTLGPRLYPNALRHAAIMVGNSSSAIIEAGTFGLPAIDVGTRQKGRERGENVTSCTSDPDEISRLLDELSGKRFDSGCNLYGDGASGPRVADVVCSLVERDVLLTKQFGEHAAVV